MVATEEEMIAADIPPDQRDYCAHHLIDFYKCKREKMPWVASCKDKLHTYRHCEEEDFMLRMKEYERERRLMERAKRKQLREGNSPEKMLSE